MATKKTPTSSQQTNHKTANHPRKPVAPHSRTPTSHTQPKRDQQARTPPRTPRRRRPTLRQRIARLSGGSWLAIMTGVLVVGILVFALIASHLGGGTGPSTTAGLLAPGTTAPAIATLPAADGKSYSLAQYKGQKVVVLEFFAPWCPHCQDETSVLKQIQQNDASQGVQVLSVSASPYGRNYEQGDMTPISMSDIQWFSSNFGLNYPALFDPSLKAGTDYQVQAFPTIYIISKQGIVTYAESSEISYASLQQQITAALSK